MGVLLVVPDGDILAGAIVVDRSTTLRTAGLRNALAVSGQTLAVT